MRRMNSNANSNTEWVARDRSSSCNTMTASMGRRDRQHEEAAKVKSSMETIVTTRDVDS